MRDGTRCDWDEIEWPQLFWRKFTWFPRLPIELRRKIWLHTLPGPRLVSLEIDCDSPDHVWDDSLPMEVFFWNLFLLFSHQKWKKKVE